jgi:hypothetical protein
VLIRLGLWLLPFRTMRYLVARTARRPSGSQGRERESARQLAWAIERVSRYVPAATCLTQALAALVLFSRAGIEARLHIGVAKDERGRLLAHAWVESEGRTVIGGWELERYRTLAVFEGDAL